MQFRSAEETHSMFRAATLRAESERHAGDSAVGAPMFRSASEVPAISTVPLDPSDFFNIFKRVGWVTNNSLQEARCYGDTDFEKLLEGNLRAAFLTQKLREPKTLTIFFPVTRFGEVEVKREYTKEAGFTVIDLLEIVHAFYNVDSLRPEEVQNLRQKWYSYELKGATSDAIGSALVPWSDEPFQTVPTWTERQITTYLYALHLDSTGTFEEKWERLQNYFNANRLEARNLAKIQQFLGPDATPVEVQPKNWPPDQIEAVLKAAGQELDLLYNPILRANALEEHVRSGKPVPVVQQTPEQREAKNTCAIKDLVGGLVFFEGFRIRNATPNSLSVSLVLGS